MNRFECGNLHWRRSFLRMAGLHLDCLVQVMDSAGLRVVLAMFGFGAERHNADYKRTNERCEADPSPG